MKNFIKSITHGLESDWEVVKLKITDIKDPALFDAKYELSKVNKPANKKLQKLFWLIRHNKPLPPIIVSKDNILRDGTHRLSLYRLFGKKKILVLRRIGKGTGKVKGKYPGKSTYPYKDINENEENYCFMCGEKVKYLGTGQGAGPISNFPQGLPSGPLWYCSKCGYNFKRNFVVWQ